MRPALTSGPRSRRCATCGEAVRPDHRDIQVRGLVFHQRCAAYRRPDRRRLRARS